MITIEKRIITVFELKTLIWSTKNFLQMYSENTFRNNRWTIIEWKFILSFMA